MWQQHRGALEQGNGTEEHPAVPAALCEPRGSVCHSEAPRVTCSALGGMEGVRVRRTHLPPTPREQAAAKSNKFNNNNNFYKSVITQQM